VLGSFFVELVLGQNYFGLIFVCRCCVFVFSVLWVKL
jgi:hypothetical protein